jgi:hypothetical protein
VSLPAGAIDPRRVGGGDINEAVLFGGSYRAAAEQVASNYVG